MRTGMSTDLVPFRIYYGNGEIRYRDSGVDLTEFQLFDIELNSPLDYSKKQVLSWLHEHLGVQPTQHHSRISMLVPKKRENGWRWELYEASNTKKYLVSTIFSLHVSIMLWIYNTSSVTSSLSTEIMAWEIDLSI